MHRNSDLDRLQLLLNNSFFPLRGRDQQPVTWTSHKGQTLVNRFMGIRVPCIRLSSSGPDTSGSRRIASRRSLPAEPAPPLSQSQYFRLQIVKVFTLQQYFDQQYSGTEPGSSSSSRSPRSSSSYSDTST